MMSVYGYLVLLCCVFISSVAPIYYNIGQNANLKCNPQHATLHSIVWHYNYETSKKEVAKWKSTDSAPVYVGQWNGRTMLNTGNGDIEIRGLELRDNGTYRCQYDERVPTPSPTIHGAIHTVNILDIFDVVALTISDTAVEGYSVTLECWWTGGNPQQITNVEWEKDGESFDRNDTELRDGNSTLTINNLVRDDDGAYVCKASNQAGPRKSQPQTIKVMYPPLPTSGSYYNLSVAEADEIVTLTCDVCSYPEERSYKWSFNGEEVGKEREHVINGMTESKFGNYSCEVSNTINGEVRTAVLIYHVQSARLPGGPSAVQDLNTTEVTSQTANVTFIPGLNGRLKQNFTVEYKLEADPDEKFQEVLQGIEDPNPTDPDEVSGPRIPVNARVGDLEAEQTYTFRVRSENDFHDENKRYSPWAYVNASTLVRPEISLNSLVYTFPSEGISEHIKFSWDIVKGQPESLTLKYRLDTVNTLADETEWMVMVEGVNPLDKEYSSETSENLDPKKDYVFILVTMEAKDVNGGASADFPVKGPDSPTNPGGPSAVQDLDTAEVTSQTVNVTFIPGFNGGLKQNFTVEYKLVTDPDEKFQEVLKGIEDPNPTNPDEVSGPRIPVNARVGDLEAEQTYTFRVRSENDFHDENKRYSSWAYVNTSTLERPEVRLNTLDYTFPSEGISEHIKFSWEIVKGQPVSLTLKYRLDTLNTLADESEWMVMVEGVNPLDKEYSSETSETLDPKKDYVFILVTMEANDVNGGASADFPVKGPDSPTNPGGSNVGAIAAGVIGVLVGIAVGVILTVLFMKRRKTTKKEEHVYVNADVPLQEGSNQQPDGLDQEPQLHHTPHPRKEQRPKQPFQQQEGEYELDEDQVKPQEHPQPNQEDGGYLSMDGHRSYYNLPTNIDAVSPYEELETQTTGGGAPNIYDRIATQQDVNVDYDSAQ